MDGILSIQSWVTYGRVGNAAAIFPLERLGFETWAVHTVQFSNHTGYGQWRGTVFPPDHIAGLIEGMAERGALDCCRAVLTGYMGDAALGEIVLDTVERVRAANPAALWLCDPVMGDVGDGFYVKPGLPEFFRDRAVPMADIITPNQFELEYLTGRTIRSLADAVEATAAARALGPKVVVLTSLVRSDAPADEIELLVATAAGTWRVATPLLPITVNGSGDAVAALFLAHWLKTGGDPAAALSAAASAIYAVLKETHARGEREIQLIAAQDELVQPREVFKAERVG
ncbi:pyridoxal kinase PdxY [Aliidongia dinghuensis]|uniref:Pyridoxal kinase PdxY n=1 Tax=Aliidongia dinghuensis TaxID=1867774 RepID=A0A8J2YZJ7_9PROT|nr:pyridoxal kinase PdxY [Aliidongia dinghuensis]GGF45856.1 pyridoxal kinase PdxY [Aliidongia dinghuensis]